jgi:hypothetical protein
MKMKTKTTQSKKQTVNPDQTAQVVRQLNRDVRDSVLVVSVVVNAYLLIGWLVLQTSNRFDASIINYLVSN